MECVLEEIGQKIFETHRHAVRFGADPLEILGLPFRIQNCPFPSSGLYSIQFWYDGEMLAERPLRLR
jgi:hypothetical protein